MLVYNPAYAGQMLGIEALQAAKAASQATVTVCHLTYQVACGALTPVTKGIAWLVFYAAKVA